MGALVGLATSLGGAFGATGAAATAIGAGIGIGGTLLTASAISSARRQARQAEQQAAERDQRFREMEARQQQEQERLRAEAARVEQPSGPITRVGRQARRRVGGLGDATRTILTPLGETGAAGTATLG